MSGVDLGENFQLENAPIIEAVIDIDCDMPPAFDLARGEDSARGTFAEDYPNLKKAFRVHHEVIARLNEPPQLTAMQALQALQFFSGDSAQLVQVRTNGYSFNRLRPYSSLDDYLPEIERTWRLFVELAQPVRVRRIAMRYINRILLPIETGSVELNQYLSLGPNLPEDHRLTYLGFLNQYSAIEPLTQNAITITLTTQPVEQAQLPIIFDIESRREFSAEPTDWDALRDIILSLRRLKNRVFKQTLSNECLKLFQKSDR